MPVPRSKPPTPVPGERTTVRESGDLLLVESPTAEEALERLSSLLGPDVEIVAAEKVTRGGIGGFFAREMVQLSARCPNPPAPAAPAPPAGPEAPLKAPDGPAERAMASLLTGSGRPTLASTTPPPETPKPAPAPPEPSGIAVAEPTVVLAPLSAMPAPVLFDPVQETESLRPGDPPGTGDPLGTGDPPGTGGVAWSADELVRLGVPFCFIRPLLETDPEDDLAWIRGLAASVHSLCRALPTGDAALVGARAGHFAAPLRIEALRRPSPGPNR